MPDNPRETKSSIGRAYWSFHGKLFADLKPMFLPWVSISVLDGVERIAEADSTSEIAALHRKMMSMLDSLSYSDERVQNDFKSLYDKANVLAHPVTEAFLKHCHSINSITRNHSLSGVDPEILREIDLLAHQDPAYKRFADDMKKKVSAKIAPGDIVSYNQFFEIFCEATVLRYLRAREGLQVARVPEAGKDEESRPDFQCWIADESSFFVEVKTLDVVGGQFRHGEMMADAINVQIDIDKQIAAGSRIAMAESEIDPYRPYGGSEDYDPGSLIKVIDTLRAKLKQAFKPSQFAMGPTFALAVIDRLEQFGRAVDLAPYYQENQTCLSGVFWHSAFGREGTPIFKHPDFEGKPSLEGHLARPGYLIDSTNPFTGAGLVIMANSQTERVAYGLKADHQPIGDWTREQSDHALQIMCDFHNDQGNTYGYRLYSS